MPKISEVVQLKAGYANFVELKSAFEEAQENMARMAMYRPTKAHRKAFERLCRGLYTPNDKKFYLLSGSYGTGKSHLCLMFANFLSRSSNDPDIRGFYENYRRIDSDTAQTLTNVRKSGQFLVAICDYHSGLRFEDVVLKGIFDACRRADLDTGVQTEFDEAERLLQQWEKSAGIATSLRNYYADFAKALEQTAPGVTVEQLRGALKEYKSDAMEQFRGAFRLAQGGMEFQAQSGNLIPIVQKLVRSRAFRDRFVGLAVFFDEFGFTLEKSAYSKDVLQGFMETICKNEPNVVFVGCIHKDFKNYADRLSQADASVMTARLTQIDLLNEGIEEIIGAIVEPDKTGALWQAEVEPKLGILDNLIPACTSLNLFPWIDDISRVRERILEDIYGVHPMALACLLRLSSEVGSDARSTFTFFSGDVGGSFGSYAEFIGSADITADGGALGMYRVPQLFDFFAKELSPRNSELRERQRQLVNGYCASLEVVRKAGQGNLLKDEEQQQTELLRTILIYDLCQMAATLENLQFGLYCLGKNQQKAVEKELQKMEKIGAVYFRKQSKTYELAASDAVDPYDLIERYIQQATKDGTLDTSVDAFVQEAKGNENLEFLPANQYNLAFNEDKRLRRRFVRAKDLEPALWKALADELADSARKESTKAEGTAVYVVCEDEAEIAHARQAVGSIDRPNIVVGVPVKAHPFATLLARTKACRHYLSGEEERKLTAQTVSRLRDMLDNADDGYLTALNRCFQTMAGGESACWYGEGGKVLVDRPKQPHRPADVLMETQYKQRCRIKHADLNQVHDERWHKDKNTALKQAVGRLLDETERVFIDSGNPANHGEIRYLQSVLLNGAGALKKTDSSGPVSYFACECDYTRLPDEFPALKDLCRRISTEPSFGVRQYVQAMLAPPYGAGGTVLLLCLAYAFRAYGERLRIYTDSTKSKPVTRQELDYDRLARMVGDPADSTYFVIANVAPVHTLLVNGVAEAVKAQKLAHGVSRTVNDAVTSLGTWWRSLPEVAKVVDVYGENASATLGKLLQVMADVGQIDRFEFLFSRFPQVYLDGPVTAGTNEAAVRQACTDFAADVALLESGQQRATTLVANAVCGVFGGKGDVVQCEKLVTKWFSGLSTTQREAHRFEDEDAATVVQVLNQPGTDFGTKLLLTIPSKLGLDSVENWASLRVKDYAAKWRLAKKAIDEAKPVLPEPVFVARKGATKKGTEKVWEINSGGTVKVTPPEGAKGLVYTMDGADPKDGGNAISVQDTLEIGEALVSKPTATLSIRTTDGDGNYGDLVQVQIVNKGREHEIVDVSDLFLKKGSFKMPEDLAGFLTVLRSLLRMGKEREFLTLAQYQKLEQEVQKLDSKQSDGGGM